MKSKKCRIDFIDEDIILFIGDGKNKLPKRYSSLRIDPERYNGISTIIHDKIKDKQINLIWIKKYDEGILIHEISHVVDRLFHICGIDDSETRAYMLEYIYESLREKRRW